MVHTDTTGRRNLLGEKFYQNLVVHAHRKTLPLLPKIKIGIYGIFELGTKVEKPDCQPQPLPH